MKLITETIEEVSVLTEASENEPKQYFIEGIFMQGDIKNRNGRIYPATILEKEMMRYGEQFIKTKRALGELGHPDGPQINLDRVSHVITSLRQEGMNWIGKAKLTDTPMGNTAKGLIESGVRLGVSSRGMGSLRLNKEGINEVQDDFHLATAADIVADPSAPDAFVNGIMEGVEWIWENSMLVAHKSKMQIETAVRSRELQERKLQIFENFLNEISKS
jgi:hypothetical protein